MSSVWHQVVAGQHVQLVGLLCIQYLRLFPAGKLHFNQQPHCVSVFRVVDFVLLIQACV
jgi:hypothetical protein